MALNQAAIDLQYDPVLELYRRVTGAGAEGGEGVGSAGRGGAGSPYTPMPPPEPTMPAAARAPAVPSFAAVNPLDTFPQVAREAYGAQLKQGPPPIEEPSRRRRILGTLLGAAVGALGGAADPRYGAQMGGEAARSYEYGPSMRARQQYTDTLGTSGLAAQQEEAGERDWRMNRAEARMEDLERNRVDIERQKFDFLRSQAPTAPATATPNSMFWDDSTKSWKPVDSTGAAQGTGGKLVFAPGTSDPYAYQDKSGRTHRLNDPTLPPDITAEIGAAQAAHQKRIQEEIDKETRVAGIHETAQTGREANQAQRTALKELDPYHKAYENSNTNYRLMAGIFEDLKKLGPQAGPQSMTLVARHMGINFPPGMGMRQSIQMIEQHIKSRSLPQGIEAWLLGMVNGSRVTLEQAQGFVDLAKRSRDENAAALRRSAEWYGVKLSPVQEQQLTGGTGAAGAPPASAANDPIAQSIVNAKKATRKP